MLEGSFISNVLAWFIL